MFSQNVTRAKCGALQLTSKNMPQEFLRNVDAGLPHRRLLEEIGKLSSDELAAVLLMWHRRQCGAEQKPSLKVRITFMLVTR
jgi:hypothetical protein